MITVDEAIGRAKDKWHVQRSHTEDETAYLDRTVLAQEVTVLREALREAENEIANLEASTDQP